MKFASLLTFLAVTFSTSLAWSYFQAYDRGGYYPSYHASTAAEGAMRGMGDVIRSQGQANLDNSQAAINLTEAQSRRIANQQQYTDTYFQMRQTNREARAAERGPRPSSQDIFRYVQMGKPQRLQSQQLDTVTGGIAWPPVLQQDVFSNDRSTLDQAFADRAASGTLSFQNSVAVSQATEAMLETMKEHIKDVPPADYVAARKFLESLAYEAKVPAG